MNRALQFLLHADRQSHIPIYICNWMQPSDLLYVFSYYQTILDQEEISTKWYLKSQSITVQERNSCSTQNSNTFFVKGKKFFFSKLQNFNETKSFSLVVIRKTIFELFRKISAKLEQSIRELESLKKRASRSRYKYERTKYPNTCESTLFEAVNSVFQIATSPKVLENLPGTSLALIGHRKGLT